MPGDPHDEGFQRRNDLITTSMMWAVQFGAGRYADAGALAARLAAVDAPVWRFQGIVCQAYTEYFRGNATAASECLEAAAANYPDYPDPDLNSLPTHPPTAFHVIGSHICWYLGRPEESDRHARLARETASALPTGGAPDLAPPFQGVFRDFNLAGVHAFEAWRLVLREDFAGAREQVRLERQVVAQHSARAGVQTVFASYDALADLCGCYAEAIALPGTGAKADAFERHLGVRGEQGPAGSTMNRWLLAELRIAEGDRAGCLHAVERGLADVAATPRPSRPGPLSRRRHRRSRGPRGGAAAGQGPIFAAAEPAGRPGLGAGRRRDGPGRAGGRAHRMRPASLAIRAQRGGGPAPRRLRASTAIACSRRLPRGPPGLRRQSNRRTRPVTVRHAGG
jgi:hypothetical protein